MRQRVQSDLEAHLRVGIALVAMGVLGACSDGAAPSDVGAAAALVEGEGGTTPAFQGTDGGSSATSAACVSGLGPGCAPVVLASGRTNPTAIAVDQTGVYWIEGTGIMAVPLLGGPPVTVASSAYVSTPMGLALGATDVYWSNNGDGTYGNTVMKAPLLPGSGNSPSAFAEPNAAPQPWGIAVANGVVYWGDHDWNAVYKAPEASASASMIWVDQIQTPDDQPTLIVADSTNVYFVTAGGDVNQTPIGGGTVTRLQPTRYRYRVTGIAVDSSDVYWIQQAVDSSASAVVMAPIGGGAVVTVVPADPSVEAVVAVDSTGVYWDNGNLMETPLGGGNPVTIAAAQNANAVAFDSTRIYWTNSEAGTVMALAK